MRISDWSSDVCSSDRDADDPAFGDRCVEHAALAVFRLQPRGRAKHAAEIADILAHHDHVRVACHHHVHRGIDRLDHVHPHAVTLMLGRRSEEHTSELQSLMRISYDVFCLKKKTNKQTTTIPNKQ